MAVIDADAISALVAEAADVQAACRALRDRLGVAHVTWHLMVNTGAPLDNPQVRTTYPATWVSHYLLNGFARIDPVVRHGLTAAAPFFWADLSPDAEGARVLADAQAAGIPLAGLSVPHADGAGRRSLLSVVLEDADRARLFALAPVLAGLAPALHDRGLGESAPADRPVPHLSPRELECLRWVAQGKSHAEIAVILGLSPHTVRGYLKTLRQQLGCVSLAQAVTQATRLRLL